MADPRDVEATRQARREFTKHRIDVTLADIRVMHGVIYIRGTIKSERGATYEDVQVECERIARLLRQKADIRDVVLDVNYRG